ncbi:MULTISPECIES: hypothetical protein [Vibrio]|uniref:hypothetical protein n=1 Tax=Vibrio TaxID=662 RepID=UPI0011102EA6|nr:hypothetical protein [Vibrio parahaemolyticus]EGS6500297.1 hypothetical protein [Vibrio parahaemolyticus]EHY9860495.1 hypothetical protein [Vibrio parahaemolyticus]EIA1625597.1 hypothetical protein [Vibrio parahaemolyticus]EIV1708404.1 hypothetical protein [Vibrio parahaemolyticus]EIV8637052.1 hypothetical protein [Vibrio parahaemolyticus]
MKKVFTILAVSTLAACANINTLENLRNDEPKSERYESGVPLVKLDENVKSYIYKCYRSKGSTVKMNGTALGAVTLSVDRNETSNGIEYVIKRWVKGGYNHWILVSLRGEGPSNSSGVIHIDDFMPSYVFGKFEKVIKNEEDISCPSY